MPAGQTGPARKGLQSFGDAAVLLVSRRFQPIFSFLAPGRIAKILATRAAPIYEMGSRVSRPVILLGRSLRTATSIYLSTPMPARKLTGVP